MACLLGLWESCLVLFKQLRDIAGLDGGESSLDIHFLVHKQSHFLRIVHFLEAGEFPPKMKDVFNSTSDSFLVSAANKSLVGKCGNEDSWP